MHKVYSNATLVIAATRSPDSTHGLFHTRLPSERVVKNFYTIPSTEGSEATSLNVRLDEKSACHQNFHIANTNLENFPLLTTTCCLQERILATCVLHFCDEELVWECHTSVKCEFMDLGASQSNLSSSTKNWYFKQRWTLIMSNTTDLDVGSRNLEDDAEDHTPKAKERPKAKRDLYQAWHMIVSTTSKLQTTKESDKLPALSGIAQKMIEHGAGAYAAGLWEANMKRDLLWAAIDTIVSRLHSRPARRAAEWRAPSWSWASMESAEIGFIDDENTSADDYDVDISEVKSTPLINDPTGNVAAASLRIEGLVTECLLGREFKEDLQKFHGRTLHLNVPGREQQMLCSIFVIQLLQMRRTMGQLEEKS